MRSTSIVLLAIAGFGFAATSYAQPDPEFIRQWSMPVEGAPLAERGLYEVESGPAFASARHLVFHPADLNAFPTRDSMPVLVWGNGGCALPSYQYEGFATTIASHGFLVLTTASVEGDAPRLRATADDLRAALDWADAENEREGSPLRGKIATEQVAAMGTSCGGGLAITIGADPRVDTIGAFNAGAVPDVPGGPPPSVSGLHGPVLILNGHERDPVMAASAALFEAIDHVPAFYGARHDASHLATFFHPGGGEFANVASNWLRFVLKGDAEAGKMFVGENCGLCTSENWETRAKALQ